MREYLWKWYASLLWGSCWQIPWISCFYLTMNAVCFGSFFSDHTSSSTFIEDPQIFWAGIVKDSINMSAVLSGHKGHLLDDHKFIKSDFWRLNNNFIKRFHIFTMSINWTKTAPFANFNEIKEFKFQQKTSSRIVKGRQNWGHKNSFWDITLKKNQLERGSLKMIYWDRLNR